MSDCTDFSDYAARLGGVLASADWQAVGRLADEFERCWLEKRQVFFCGNGGSAGNAVHLANDFIYGIAKRHGGGLRAQALSANTAVLTCLANDIGYEQIYAEQLAVMGGAGDVLVVLSGSGNSPNVTAALTQAREMGIFSAAILGYSGGRCRDLADLAIHFPIDDMQVAEDMQLVVGHMLMQRLYARRHKVSGGVA